MSEKYHNKYRITSARLKNWDYRSNGAYFITICTKNMEWYFGKIVNAKFIGNPIGLLAEYYWLEIPQHFPFMELGNFVVMPNHVHGILIVDNSKIVNHIAGPGTDVKKGFGLIDGTGAGLIDETGAGMIVQTLQCNVSTTTPTAIPPSTPKNEQMAKISPKSGAVSTIIRSYKSIVSKHAHFINPDFDWQTRFHDHIIRDTESFERIQDYIENNPANWDKDKFHQ